MRILSFVAYIVFMAGFIWFSVQAERNLSAAGKSLYRRPRIGRGVAPPYGKKWFTPQGWRYRKIVFVFQGLLVVATIGCLASLKR